MCQQEMTTQPIGSGLSRELFAERKKKLIRNKNVKRSKISHFKFSEVRWKNQASGNIGQGFLGVFYKKCKKYYFLYPVTPMIF